MKTKKKIINVGLIGAGNWAVNYIKTINKLPYMNLKLVYSTNSKIEKYLDKDCYLTSNIDLFIKKNFLDGIIIATPPSVQYSLAIKFITLGIPLLLEKPLCTSIKEAQILLKTSYEKKSSVLVNNIYLYSEAFKVFKNKLINKKLIKTFISLDGNKGPYREYMNAAWDWGPHSLSMCMSIMGYPISANLKELVNSCLPGQNYELNLNFKNGSSSTLIFGNAMKEKTRYFEIQLESDKIIFDDKLDRKVFKKTKSGNIEYYDYSNTDPLVSVLNKFYKNIVENFFDLGSLQMNYAIVYILESLLLKNIMEFDFIENKN